jgi:chemotaxis protein methyltransferase CheR
MIPPRLHSFDLELLLQRIGRKTGLSFPQVRHNEIAAAIRRLMKKHSIPDVSNLIERLDVDADLYDAAIAEVTVGETYFFRDPAQFDAIRATILPSLLDKQVSSSSRIRIWSAGCSTGEEAYSLAILMEEMGLGERAHILATDISRSALAKAQRAEYGSWSFRNDQGKNSERYFCRDGQRFQLAERFRHRVSFGILNLAADCYPSVANGTAGVDLILCRNVLIYFDEDTVRWTAQRLFQCLAEGGWLVIGPSDPPLWDYAPFGTTITPGGVLYQRKAGPAVSDQRDRQRQKKGPAPHSRRLLRKSKALIGAAVPPHPRATADAADNHSRVSRLTQSMEQADNSALRIRSLCDNGQLAEAEETARSAVAKHQFSPELHYLQGILFIARNRESDAIAALRRSIYLDRTLVAAYFALGSVLQRTDPQAALRAFAAARTLCSARPSDDAVPLTGDTAASLAENAQAQIDRLSASQVSS